MKPGAPGVNVVPAISRAVGPAVMTCPSMVVIIGSVTSDGAPKPVLPFGRAIVFEPTINCPAVLREINVPPTITPEAPGVKVVPPMAILLGAAVMTSPPIVVTIEFGGADSRGTVFEPTINSLAVFKDSNVLSSVIPGAPGIRVVPKTIIAFGAAVMTWPAMLVVNVSRTFDPKGIVLEPITNSPAELRDNIVPSIVVPGAPGFKVLPAIAIALATAVIA